MTDIKKCIKLSLRYFAAFFLILIYTFFFYIVPVNASGGSNSSDLAEQTAAFAGQQGAGIETDRDVREVAALIIRSALGLIGIIFLGYGIYGGYVIMMSRGNEEKVAQGKKTLLTAVIGVIVILGAYAITLAIARIVTPRSYESGVDVWVEPDYSDYYNSDPLGF
ncbi:MAG: hypothetical protein GF349_02580 [Candidatus Magasanikbacteria bacterium]|nr:hypothetical protein [Candidatus Magasanikbacteria bacterium]